ncbi:MAG TPA: Uma2 family endonuclease [Enhygromyxa sp.]|nr:Uma2 family endonuclease [Enhygromyxa sp.]
MTDGATAQTMSAAEYLEWEREQIDKHEFHHGEVFAMAGGSPRHNRLAARLLIQLSAATAEKGCEPQTSDQKIAAEPLKRYVYPDVVLICGPFQSEAGARDVLTNPAIVVEVLSASTETYDRGMKWRAYQSLASLTDYLLVSQRDPFIEHYRREADGSWRYSVYGAGDTITLANQAQLAVDPIYQGVFELDGDSPEPSK